MQWLAIAAAYLIGSIPFGLIVARFHKVDLRAAGSGNIGATNALRVMGRTAGAITLAGDVLKGSLAVYLAIWIAGHNAGLFAAAAVVIGHDFSIFTGFRGGKGVATTFGAVIALEPVVALAVFALWLFTVIAWRFSSLGAIVSFSFLPVIAVFVKPGDGSFLAMSLFLTALAIVKHRTNIARLIRGEEPRIGAKTA